MMNESYELPTGGPPPVPRWRACELLKGLVQRLTFPFFLIPIRIEVPGSDSAFHDDGLSIVLKMRVLDRDNGEMTEVALPINADLIAKLVTCCRDESAADLLMRRVVELVVHELAECAHYNGRRLWDPHLPDSRFPKIDLSHLRFLESMGIT